MEYLGTVVYYTVTGSRDFRPSPENHNRKPDMVSRTRIMQQRQSKRPYLGDIRKALR